MHLFLVLMLVLNSIAGLRTKLEIEHKRRKRRKLIIGKLLTPFNSILNPSFL